MSLIVGSDSWFMSEERLTEMMWPPKPWAASAHSITALSWGYPTPVFLRVVHTEPVTTHAKRTMRCISEKEATFALRRRRRHHLVRCRLWWCQPRPESAPPPSLPSPHFPPGKNKSNGEETRQLCKSCSPRKEDWPWWCGRETSLWRPWRSERNARSSRWPHRRRCTAGLAPLPVWLKSSQSRFRRCLCWPPRSGKHTSKRDALINTDKIGAIMVNVVKESTFKHSGCFAANSAQSSTE